MLRKTLMLAGRQPPTRYIVRRMLPRDMTVGFYFHHVDFESFKSWFAQMQTIFEFVSYDDAIDAVHQGDHSGRRAFISFDDGFASTLNAGLFLADAEVTAAHFVCSSIVGQPDRQVAESFGYRQPEPVLGWADLEVLANAGQQIESHTSRHINLGIASDDEIVTELSESKQAITTRFGKCDHLAWPFGRPQHVSSAVFAVGRDLGYRSVASAIRGVHKSAAPSPVPFRHVVAPGEHPSDTLMFVALAASDLDKPHRIARASAERMAELGLAATTEQA